MPKKKLLITDDNGWVIFENIPLGTSEILGMYNSEEFRTEITFTQSDRVITIELQQSQAHNKVIYAFGITLAAAFLLIIVLLRHKISAIFSISNPPRQPIPAL